MSDDAEHDPEWQQFKLNHPEFFYQFEQSREYRDLQELLAYYGPRIASIMAERLRAREKAEAIQHRLNVLMGVCAGLGVVSLALAWRTYLRTVTSDPW